MIRNTDRPLRRRCHERWRDGIRNGLREDRIDLAAARLIDVPALDLLQRVELLGRRAPPERNRRSLVENPSYGERAAREQARDMAEYRNTT